MDYYMGDDVKGLVRQIEGFSKKAYVDAMGHSIGYGHLIKPGEEHLLTKELTREEAEKYLEEDIQSHQKTWIGRLDKNTPGNVVTALTSFAYNVGPNAPALHRAVDAVSKGDVEAATKIMVQYNKSKDPKTGKLVLNNVLVARRDYETRLLKGDKVSWESVRREHRDRGPMGKMIPKVLEDVIPFAKKSPVEYFKQMFGVREARMGTALSSATQGGDGCASSNATTLQGLRELNNQLGADAQETRWLQRLKAEGSGLWAAGQ